MNVLVDKSELERLLLEHEMLMFATGKCDSIRCQDAHDGCFHTFKGLKDAVEGKSHDVALQPETALKLAEQLKRQAEKAKAHVVEL